MKRLTVVITASLVLFSTAGAQETASDTSRGARWIFRAPVFVLQPGLVTTNFIDAPEGVDASTEFHFRMVTAIPTTIPRTTLVGIVQWTPFNRADGFTANAPSFVYGPVFNIFNTRMLSLDFDVLGAYGPAAREDDESAYTHKLVLEGDLFLKLGQMMSSQPDSRWRSLSLYGMLANVATGLPDGASRWVLLTGFSLPIAP